MTARDAARGSRLDRPRGVQQPEFLSSPLTVVDVPFSGVSRKQVRDLLPHEVGHLQKMAIEDEVRRLTSPFN